MGTYFFIFHISKYATASEHVAEMKFKFVDVPIGLD